MATAEQMRAEQRQALAEILNALPRANAMRHFTEEIADRESCCLVALSLRVDALVATLGTPGGFGTFDQTFAEKHRDITRAYRVKITQRAARNRPPTDQEMGIG